MIQVEEKVWCTSEDMTISVWEMIEGKGGLLSNLLKYHESMVTAIAKTDKEFGGYVITSDMKGNLVLWQEEKVFKEIKIGVSIFSLLIPQGEQNTLWIGTNQKIILWNLQDSEELTSFAAHSDKIESLLQVDTNVWRFLFFIFHFHFYFLFFIFHFYFSFLFFLFLLFLFYFCYFLFLFSYLFSYFIFHFYVIFIFLFLFFCFIFLFLCYFYFLIFILFFHFLLFSGSSDSINVWPLKITGNSPTPIKVLKGHSLGVTSMAKLMYESDTIVFSGSYDKHVGIWKVSEYLLIEKLALHADAIRSLLTVSNGVIWSAGDDCEAFQISFSSNLLGNGVVGKQIKQKHKTIKKKNSEIGSVKEAKKKEKKSIFGFLKKDNKDKSVTSMENIYSEILSGGKGGDSKGDNLIQLLMGMSGGNKTDPSTPEKEHEPKNNIPLESSQPLSVISSDSSPVLNHSTPLPRLSTGFTRSPPPPPPSKKPPLPPTKKKPPPPPKPPSKTERNSTTISNETSTDSQPNTTPVSTPPINKASDSPNTNSNTSPNNTPTTTPTPKHTLIVIPSTVKTSTPISAPSPPIERKATEEETPAPEMPAKPENPAKNKPPRPPRKSIGKFYFFDSLLF